jgi:2-amino-4-hydroxy-6-hydroxymethyldihydropteridine diphosphokinase
MFHRSRNVCRVHRRREKICGVEGGVGVLAYVGLGGNLGDRRSYLERAVELLGRQPGVRVVRVSSYRETDPVGYVDQPRFLNGAVAIETELGARELLERLLAVERALGRERTGPRFGPRTIDLDLLLYGDETIEEPGLTVPHPRLAERRFVLEPLAELDPELVLPDGRRVAELLDATG